MTEHFWIYTNDEGSMSETVDEGRKGRWETHATELGENFLEVALFYSSRETRDVKVVSGVVVVSTSVAPIPSEGFKFSQLLIAERGEKVFLTYLPRSPPSLLSFLSGSRTGERERLRARAPRGEGERSLFPFPAGACQSIGREGKGGEERGSLW